MGQAFQLTVNQSGIATLGFDLPRDPVEQFNARIMRELSYYLNSLKGTTSVRAMVVRRVEINANEATVVPSKLQDRPWSVEELSARGQELLSRLAALPFPTVAVLDGHCLGPELEFALACTYRVATSDPDTRLGLPNIEYGLIPCLGGTQRLPRLVGFEHALRMIVDGARVNGRTALKWGLADTCCPRAHLVDALPAFLVKIQTTRGRADILDHRRPRLLTRLAHDNWLSRRILVERYRQRLVARSPGLRTAPLRALELLRATLKDRLDHGLMLEAKEYSRLAETRTAKELLRLHHTEHQLRQLPVHQGYHPTVKINSIGIIGDGAVGKLVEQLTTNCGIPTRTVEVADLPTEGDCHQFAGVDIVVETAVEDPQVKKEYLQRLEQAVRDDCMLVTTTGFLPLAALGQGLKHAGRLIGMNFLPDTARGPLVEIVRGPQTRSEYIVAATELARRLGYTPLIAQGTAGFVVNRLRLALFNETIHLLADGADPLFIDKVMRDFGMRRGPCVQLDCMGLGEVWYAGKVLEGNLGKRFRWNEMLGFLCNEHGLGSDTKPGIFIRRHGRLQVNPRFSKLTEEYRAYVGRSPRYFSKAAVRDRLSLVVVNEAFHCLAEGIVRNHKYLDYAAVSGGAFAALHGGPLTWAESVGLDFACRQLTELELQHGSRFEPNSVLVHMVNNAAIYIRREEDESLLSTPTPIMHPEPLPSTRVPAKQNQLRLAI